MSTVDDSCTLEPGPPPRELLLCPRPSAMKVVGRWGTRAGTTTAAARAATPTMRPVVAKAVAGSGPVRPDVPGADVPHARNEPTDCRPMRASQHSAAGTAYQAANPSPELVAEPRKADNRGMPASAGLRYVTPIASTASAVRPTSRLIARIVPRLDGAGADEIVTVSCAWVSRMPNACPVSGVGTRSAQRCPRPCSSDATYTRAVACPSTTSGRCEVTRRSPIPASATTSTRITLGRNHVSGANRVVTGNVTAMVASAARRASIGRVRFTGPPRDGRRRPRPTRAEVRSARRRRWPASPRSADRRRTTPPGPCPRHHRGARDR